MVVAGLVAVSTLALGVAAPVSAADLDGNAVYWKIGQNGIRGLVAVIENPDISTVAFHLTGLKSSHAYKLQGFMSPCGQPGTRLFSRSFTSTAKGIAWDPTPVAPGSDGLVSMRVRDVASGKVVACSTSPAGSVDPQTAVIKLKKTGGLRGLVVVDGRSGTRVVGSFSGLAADADYLIHGASGLCTQLALLTLTVGLSSNGKGVARIDVLAPPVTAGSNETMSVGIHRVGSNKGACGNAINLA